MKNLHTLTSGQETKFMVIVFTSSTVFCIKILGTNFIMLALDFTKQHELYQLLTKKKLLRFKNPAP